MTVPVAMSADDHRLSAALAEYVAALAPHWPVVGGSVALVDRDRTISTFGFGLADRERGEVSTRDHLFQIGSISKSFVSVLVNQLCDEGLIDLDAPVTAYLPWVDLGANTPEVTLRRLLSHTAGLVMGADAVPDDVAQLWQLRTTVVSAGAREHFHYSNVGYMLLGQVVRAVTGARLADALDRRVFGPLGMSHSLGRMGQIDRSRMATGYWPARDDIPWAPGDALSTATWFEIDAADGNVASSAVDMAQWARFFLGDGQVGGARVVAPETLERILTATAAEGETVLRLRDGPMTCSSRYGLGVNLEQIGDATCVTHGGGMVGFGSFLLADRTHGVGVVVLTNANGCYPVAQVIARAAHLLLTQGPGAALPPAADPLDTFSTDAPLGEAWLRAFVADGSPCGAPDRVVVRREGLGPITLDAGGHTGTLTPTWTSQFVTTHPLLRQFRWQPRGDERDPTWTYGPTIYRPAGRSVVDRDAWPEVEPDEDARAVIGTYRCYSPWFPTFRIIWRQGRLYLVSPGGVEAWDDDCELVRDGPGWRIGLEPWLPERITPGPVVDGVCIYVHRDDLLYSRLDR